MLKPDVQTAIDELKWNFPTSIFVVREDNEGGAYVIVEGVELASKCHPYVQENTWVGFRIHFQYPISDIYPIFVRGDLSRKDGKALGEATSLTTFEGRPAVQLSRRSNRRNADLDTATLKVKKVLQWLQEK